MPFDRTSEGLHIAGMNEKKDITSRGDIHLLVDEFYALALKDDLLGPVFNGRIAPENWPEHKEHIYLFWETVLLGVEDPEGRYAGSPFASHIGLGIEAQHFQRWLELFGHTVNHFFSGMKAEEAVWRAEQMAKLFAFKLSSMQQKGNIPLI